MYHAKNLHLKLFIFIISFFCSTCNNNDETSKHYRLKNDKLSYEFDRNFPYFISLDIQGEADYKSYWLCLYDDVLWGANIRESKLVVYKNNLDYQTYGMKGGSPNEIDDISYFKIDTSFYSIFDLQKQRYASFTFDNVLTKELKFSKSDIFVERLGVSPKKGELFILYFDNKEQEYKIGIYNQQQGLRKSFTLSNLLSISKSFKGMSVTLDGSFLQCGKFAVYYLFRAGKFLVYDASKDIFQSYNTIDNTPIPELVEVALPDGGFSYEANPDFIISSDATMSEQKLYILSSVELREEKTIDTYALSTGEYEGSIKIKGLSDGQKPELIAVEAKDKYLWIQYDNLTFHKWLLTTSKK